MKKRYVQIGDSVIFEGKVHKIIEIYSDKSIKISNEDNELKLQPEDYLNNKVKFISIFTGKPYLDIEILAFVDMDTLEIICNFNDYISELCNNEDLWRRKLELKYGKDILDYVKDDLKLKYEFLLENGIDVDSSNQAAKDGYLDILKWLLEEHNILPNYYYGANSSARFGHLDVLIWLKENHILPNMIGANMAAGGGYLDILILLEKNGILPDQNGANFAAENGYLYILKWLEKYKILPNKRVANMVAENGHRYVLEWLAKRDIFPDNL